MRRRFVLALALAALAPALALAGDGSVDVGRLEGIYRKRMPNGDSAGATYTTTDVLRLVVREGMTPALIGIALGSVASLASAQLLNRLVYGISASDPLTLAMVAGALALVALAATLVPAYRAARLDPLQVLRSS